MQALRDRFQPNRPNGEKDAPSSASSPRMDGVRSRDYFTYIPASPTVRAPSLPSITPKFGMTPAIAPMEKMEHPSNLSTEQSTNDQPAVGRSTAGAFNSGIEQRQSTSFNRRASAIRKQVGAGDLAMTSVSGPSENGGAYYRPTVNTPSLPRMDTWRGRLSNSTTDVRQHHGVPVDSSPDEEEEAFELREAVLTCIAKSIGLAQPNESNLDGLGQSSVAPLVSAASTPNSPMFPPNGKGSTKSPFGNLLDMMNASTQNDNAIGGLLREAVMNARHDDEASSVSASVQDSHTPGTEHNKNTLRDLEGKVEILYYKQGTELVKAGQRSPGIYYVIDGFLEVSHIVHRSVSLLTVRCRFRCPEPVLQGNHPR